MIAPPGTTWNYQEEPFEVAHAVSVELPISIINLLVSGHEVMSGRPQARILNGKDKFLKPLCFTLFVTLFFHLS